MNGTTAETQRKESLLVNVIREARAYELMSILVPDMAEEDTQATIDRINGYITSATGEITQTLVDSPWGRRRLAYTMRFSSVDYRDGFYILIHFSASPNAITDIERDLKLDTGVIRYLLVMDDPKAGEQANNQDVTETGAQAEPTQPTAADVAEQPRANEPVAPTAASPAGQAEVEKTESGATSPVATTGEVEEVPVTRQEQIEESDESIEETAAAVAEQIEGEENPAPADAPESQVERTASRKLPDEGEGEAWVAGDATRNVPEGFPIKGNASSKIFHPKESPSYDNTVAEIYFSSNEAAERYGYRLPKTLQQAGGNTVNAGADLAQSAIDAVDSDSREG